MLVRMMWMGIVAFVVIGTGGVTAQESSSETVFGYTYQRADGNRWIAGQGSLPDARTLDIQLAGRPEWVVAAPLGSAASVWVAVLDDGRVQAFRVEGTVATPVTIMPEQLPPGMPPLLMVKDGIPSLVVAPPEIDASPLTHPVVIDEAGTLAVVSVAGDLLLVSPDGSVTYPLADRGVPASTKLLPDARLLQIGAGRLVLLADPVSDYPHGALGDDLEAHGVLIVDLSPDADQVWTVGFGGDNRAGIVVSEAIMPLWADLNGDGVGEVVVTLSDASVGARLAAASFDGATLGQLIEGPAIGQGYRWRHQIAAAPFGPHGEIEVVDVRTPHIGGIVEFYRFDGESLDIVMTRSDYTSHGFGSRNLDRAAAGDFDGDGHVELLVPTWNADVLAAIRRTENGADEVWMVSAGGPARTNLAGVTLSDGRMLVGVGRADNVLRIWLAD